MKICIYGAGAIGGYIAAHLARAGQCEVSVVARGRTLEVIRADGVTIVKRGERFSVPVNAVEDPRGLGVQDYVIIALKVHQLDAVLGDISTLIGPDTAIIPPNAGLPYWFLENLPGPVASQRLPRLDINGRQWATMPPRQVIAAPFWIGVHSLSPGVVELDGSRGTLPMGELDGTTSPRLVRFSKLMGDAGIEAPISDNIHGEIWVKFVNALCWNPTAILTLARLGEIDNSDGVADIVLKMMEEADRIGREIGVKIEETPAERIYKTLRGKMHKMSMLQDFERNRPTELESLYTSLCTLKDLRTLPTPTLDTVYALARLRLAVREARGA